MTTVLAADACGNDLAEIAAIATPLALLLVFIFGIAWLVNR